MSDSWYENEEDTSENNISFSEYDISASPNDFNLLTLNSFIGSGIVEIPGFQRNYIWDIRRASKLIESILIGIPIPQIFLYEASKNKFLVIDGQQRYMTIYYFMKKRFPLLEKRVQLRRIFLEKRIIPDEILMDNAYFQDFNLDLPVQDGSNKNVFDTKNYFTLSDEMKTTFELRTIRNIIIKQNFPRDDDSVVYEIFNRLNSGGVNLTPQEIRASMYHSDFLEMVNYLNIIPGWRTILQQQDPDLHMKDVEILLRAFAILEDNQNYKPPMSKFINVYAKKTKGFGPAKIDYFKSLFIEFISMCSRIDSNVFFTKGKKFNISIFESLFFASCTETYKSHGTSVKALSNQIINKIKDDPEYAEAISSRTTGSTNVKTRLRIASEKIK